MSLNFTHIKGDTFEAVNFAVKVNTVARSIRADNNIPPNNQV